MLQFTTRREDIYEMPPGAKVKGAGLTSWFTCALLTAD